MQRSALLNALAARIVAIHRHHPTRVAIDGVDAAGKTTLADELVAPVQTYGRRVIRASIDGFLHPRAVRYRLGDASANGYYFDSFNYEAVKVDLLAPLGPGGSRQFRIAAFDFLRDAEVRPPLETASEHDILLFDGVFLQRPELAGYWDWLIWVEAPFNVTVPRALARAERQGQISQEALRALAQRYQKRYVPGQELYINSCHPKERAQIVVYNDDYLNPEIDEPFPISE